ncbi:MAG: sugar lactone lactonase YvrE [Pirellulaceae bacterium]
MRTYKTEILLKNDDPSLRFLPEGPYRVGNDRLSWVAIQHSADATNGSLNLLDLQSGENKNYALPGRPGFAFPTDRDGVFVVGLERHIQLFDINSGQSTIISDAVEEDVENTIINDGLVIDGGLIFGCKDLEFATEKAGLYLYRTANKELVRLRNDQICSNGKIFVQDGDKGILYDIDSPTRTVVKYEIDIVAGTASEPTVVIDLRKEPAVPDGMVETPDGKSCIISFYDPNPSPYGTSRQYSLETGELEAVWQTDRAPRVTCPQLVRIDGVVKLVMTTAVEHMSDEEQAEATNSGNLFVGETEFDDVPANPLFVLASQ